MGKRKSTTRTANHTDVWVAGPEAAGAEAAGAEAVATVAVETLTRATKIVKRNTCRLDRGCIT